MKTLNIWDEHSEIAETRAIADAEAAYDDAMEYFNEGRV
jgi:hypothetical protein